MDLTPVDKAYDLAFAVDPNNEKQFVYWWHKRFRALLMGGQNFDPASHWTLSYGPTFYI